MCLWLPCPNVFPGCWIKKTVDLDVAIAVDRASSQPEYYDY